MTARAVKHLNELPGTHAERVWTGGMFSRVGRADVTGCVEGQRFDLEAKEPGKKARKVQAANLLTWERSGSVVGVFTNLAEAEALVELARERARCR